MFPVALDRDTQMPLLLLQRRNFPTGKFPEVVQQSVNLHLEELVLPVQPVPGKCNREHRVDSLMSLGLLLPAKRRALRQESNRTELDNIMGVRAVLNTLALVVDITKVVV